MGTIDRSQNPAEGDRPLSAPSTDSPICYRGFPPRRREQLIQQFQGIDHSSRSEAATQVEAFERDFLATFGEASGLAASRANADKATGATSRPGKTSARSTGS